MPTDKNCIRKIKISMGIFFSLLYVSVSANHMHEESQQEEITPIKAPQEKRLMTGDWSGSYTLFHSETIDVIYKIRYSDEEVNQLTITMILDLEPQSEHTHVLEEITLKASTLKFTIQKQNEIKNCKLTLQDNNDFLGKCQSNKDKDGNSLSNILMIPPVSDKLTTNDTD